MIQQIVKTQGGRIDCGPAPALVDLELVRAVRSGNVEARAELVSRLVDLPQMIRLKNLRMAHPLTTQDVEDVIQESFLALWTKLENFDARASIERWAWGIATIELMRALQRRARRARPDPGLDVSLLVAPEPKEHGVDIEMLASALARLSERDTNILMLHHIEGLTFREIGTRIDMLVSTVKTRYLRSLVRLREYMGSTERARGS